ETFWHKIQEQLPGSIWDHYQRFRRVLHVSGMPAKSYEEQQGVLKTLNRAILQHRVVQIEYQSLGKPVSTRLILPYAIVFYQSSLYIIAAEQSADDPEQALRHWKLDRFLSAEALDDYFTADQEFDLTQYLGQSLGIFSQQGVEEFQVRISAFASPRVIEDPWHADQKVERQEDGSILLTVKATHELEVIPRVLALGTEAELLSPPTSRQRMQAIIADLQATYSGGDSD
ncbi:MAG: WYL domain-containing protein, partial [Planctomycetaceae bacterium]|nr:WYL domain-containing protein [Planctomycetaceae bacterium]